MNNGSLYLGKPKQLEVVKTGDETPHPINHIRDVPLSHVDQRGMMRNVLHIQTIIKNPMLAEQILD